MLFYKYQKPGNLEFNLLRRGEVYFASGAELNDASEFRPRFVLKGSEELWQRLAGFILEHACFCSGHFKPESDDQIRQILGLQQPIGRQLKKKARNRDFGIENLRPAFQEALRLCGSEKLQPALMRQVGDLASGFIEEGLPHCLMDEKYIASFALNATNPTMWGHYADAEKGFVRVFETADGKVNVQSDINILHGTRPSEKWTEVGIYKEEGLKLTQVEYRRELPKVNAFHRLIHQFLYSEKENHYDVPLLLGGDAEQKKEHLVGLVKHSDWRYEREIRAFFPAFESLLPDVRVLRISLNNIKGLIFGPKMSSENRARAVLCCHLMKRARRSEESTQHEFSFFEARQGVNRFDFEIRPVGLLDGPYFGRHLPLRSLRKLDAATIDRLHAAADEIAGRKQIGCPTGR